MPASSQTSRLADPLYALLVRLGDIASKGRISFVVKVGISAGLVVLAFRHIDSAALIQSFAGQSALWIGATLLLGFAQIALLGVRWQQVLKGLGSEARLASALSVTFMGCFFGAFLLGPTGGDVARAVLAPARSLGRRRVVHSVLFERVASVIGLGLAATPLVLLNSGPLAHSLPLVATVALIPLTLLAMTIVVWLARAFRRCGGSLFYALREFDQSWRRLVRAWPRLAAAVALAALGQALVAVEAWSLAQSQHLAVPLVDFALLMPPVMLLVALPVSAGGWGVREGALVAALALVGVAPAPALLLSIELGVIGTLVSLPGGALWLHRCFSRRRAPICVA